MWDPSARLAPPCLNRARQSVVELEAQHNFKTYLTFSVLSSSFVPFQYLTTA